MAEAMAATGLGVVAGFLAFFLRPTIGACTTSMSDPFSTLSFSSSCRLRSCLLFFSARARARHGLFCYYFGQRNVELAGWLSLDGCSSVCRSARHIGSLSGDRLLADIFGKLLTPLYLFGFLVRRLAFSRDFG